MVFAININYKMHCSIQQGHNKYVYDVCDVSAYIELY